MLEKYYIITFASSTFAMSAKFILSSETGFRIIPLPTEIDASCGLCLKIEYDQFENIYQKIIENKIEFERVFICELDEERLKCTILTMRQQQ